MFKIKRLFLLIVFLYLVDHSAVHGCIIDPASMGAKSFGMGSAVVALADELMSALYVNPAGLIQLEDSNFAMGANFLDTNIRYKSPDGYSEENSAPGFVPFFGYSDKLSDKVAIGIGMYSTLGIGFKFRNYSINEVKGDIKNISGVMVLSPTVSYKINQKLSIGIQAQIGYTKSEIDMPTPAGYLKTDSDGFGVAPAIGLLYKPTSFLNLGIKWKSSMKTPLEGDVDLFTIDGQKVDDSLDLDLYWPQMFEFGMAYKVRPDLVIAAFGKWSDWSYFGNSEFKFRNMKDFDRPVCADIKDGIRWGIGAEYKPRQNLALRCGYFHNPYSVESNSLSPLLVDLSYDEVRVGVEIKFGKFNFVTSYNYAFLQSRKGTGAYPGKYGGFVPIWNSQISYQF
jgi:long-chain fatty acid transport protein